MVGFVLPSMLALEEFKGELTKSKRIMHYSIMIFGAFGAIFSITYTIINMVNGKS